MLPMCLDDMLPAEAEVRAIDVIVERMEIPSMEFTYSETKETGRKLYNPVDMFKLYAYSYFNGIRSSRKIERECHRDIEVMWLINGLKPDFKTISDFRKNNKEPIKQVFHKFSMICDDLGLIGKEMIAVDGSKFRASNSRFAYHSEKKVQKKIEHYYKIAEQYLLLLDRDDKQESDRVTPKLNRSEIEEKIKGINKRLSELKELEQRVKENGTIYGTNPDSRMMQTNNKGCDICHNVQMAVDDKNHLVVVLNVTSEPVDKEQLHNVSLQAKEELGVETITVIADKGYYSALQFAKCKEDNIVPIVSKADRSFMAVTKEYEKSRFKYDETQDGYICPQGHLLKAYHHRKEYTQETDIKRYQNFEACSNCPVRDKCSNGKKGRTIQDRPFQRIADEVDRRTEQFAEMYKIRKQTVEHPFGTVKRAMGFSYFLTRRTENVRTESLLHFLVYNMKRAIDISGTKQLIGVLQG
jgi:Transposase and inactivated derivatives